MTRFDVVIVGSGVVGASAALLLAKHTKLNIAVMDIQNDFLPWQSHMIDHRVSAISPASEQLFASVGAWTKMAEKRISPYKKMQVWDAESKGQIVFDCRDTQAQNLGHIIEDSVIRASLRETFDAFHNLHFLHPIQLKNLYEEPEGIRLVTEDQQTYFASLLIAADGAHSWVRDKVGICLKERDYQQTAIVATVKTAKSHEQTARQRFLQTGPLAFLPLADSHTSSIVWSTTPEQAHKLLVESDQRFAQLLGEAFENTLGEILAVSERYNFALTMRHAKNYVKPHLALIGDAAHTIHPLAGQGVNLGLQDAACLVRVIKNALTKQRDYKSLSTLRQYERQRKSENLIMLTAVDGLKYLFLSPKKSLTALRRLGLNLADRVSIIKDFFVKTAMGGFKV